MNMIPASKLVNMLGKYLYKHIDSAFKYNVSGNMNDIYFYVYYQRSRLNQDWTKPDEYNDMHEMTINLNLTTYSNKIRINLIEVSPSEKTLGHATIECEKLQDLKSAHILILDKVHKLMKRAYKDYEFIF